MSYAWDEPDPGAYEAPPFNAECHDCGVAYSRRACSPGLVRRLLGLPRSLGHGARSVDGSENRPAGEPDSAARSAPCGGPSHRTAREQGRPLRRPERDLFVVRDALLVEQGKYRIEGTAWFTKAGVRYIDGTYPVIFVRV